MGYTGSDPTIIQFEIKKSYQLLSRFCSFNVVTAVSLDDEPVSEEAGHLTPEGEHELRLGQTEQEGLGVDSEESSELAYQTARIS